MFLKNTTSVEGIEKLTALTITFMMLKTREDAMAKMTPLLTFLLHVSSCLFVALTSIHLPAFSFSLSADHGNQLPCILISILTQDLMTREMIDNSTILHHDDPITHLAHSCNIMGYKQVRHT